MKPVYEESGRTILKVEKLIKKRKVTNPQTGQVTEEVYEDISREAKVVGTTVETLGWKKGDIVYYNPRGCVNVEALSNKKYMLLAVDNIDIYVVL